MNKTPHKKILKYIHASLDPQESPLLYKVVTKLLLPPKKKKSFTRHLFEQHKDIYKDLCIDSINPPIEDCRLLAQRLTALENLNHKN